MLKITFQGGNFLTCRNCKNCTIIKKIHFINFNTNYRREMKHKPVNNDYCLLQFDALKCFLGVRLHGGLYLTLNFSLTHMRHVSMLFRSGSQLTYVQGFLMIILLAHTCCHIDSTARLIDFFLKRYCRNYLMVFQLLLGMPCDFSTMALQPISAKVYVITSLLRMTLDGFDAVR